MSAPVVFEPDEPEMSQPLQVASGLAQANAKFSGQFAGVDRGARLYNSVGVRPVTKQDK